MVPNPPVSTRSLWSQASITTTAIDSPRRARRRYQPGQRDHQVGVPICWENVFCTPDLQLRFHFRRTLSHDGLFFGRRKQQVPFFQEEDLFGQHLNAELGEVEVAKHTGKLVSGTNGIPKVAIKCPLIQSSDFIAEEEGATASARTTALEDVIIEEENNNNNNGSSGSNGAAAKPSSAADIDIDKVIKKRKWNQLITVRDTLDTNLFRFAS